MHISRTKSWFNNLFKSEQVGLISVVGVKTPYFMWKMFDSVIEHLC